MNHFDQLPSELNLNILKYLSIEDEIDIFPGVVKLKHIDIVEIFKYRFPYFYNKFASYDMLSDITLELYKDLRWMYFIDLTHGVSDISEDKDYDSTNVIDLLRENDYYPNINISKIVMNESYSHLMQYVNLSDILVKNQDKLLYDISWILRPEFEFERPEPIQNDAEYYDTFYEWFQDFLEDELKTINLNSVFSFFNYIAINFPITLIENNLAIYLFYIYFYTKGFLGSKNDLINCSKGKYNFVKDLESIELKLKYS